LVLNSSLFPALANSSKKRSKIFDEQHRQPATSAALLQWQHDDM
jgi:hypothetical protein